MKLRSTFLAIAALLMFRESGFAQKSIADYPKNTVQIGETGYYFDNQNPFSFGTFFPYISYARKITRTLSFRTSIERYHACYYCMRTAQELPIPAFQPDYRQFNLLQLNALYEFLINKKLSLILAGGGGYRWATWGEEWGYGDEFPIGDIITDGKSFYEWGAGGALEVRYKFYKGFSLSVKGEYLNFPVRPTQHWGAGAYIGYDF